MSDSPKDFFDEVTKEINLSPPTASEDTGKTADPTSSAETKIIAPTVATPKAPSPPIKDIQIKIPPKMPEFSEAPKGPQGRIIQETSTPTRMAASPPPLPEIPKPTEPAEVPDVDIDLSDDPRESVKTDYGSRSADRTFKSLPSRNEVQEAVGDNFQIVGIALIIFVVLGGSYYIFKHRGGSASETNIVVSNSTARNDGLENNWQMNLSRSWLNFGPVTKNWKDFQKSMDQAMVDLGPVEH